MSEAQEQHDNSTEGGRSPWLKKYQFKKGESGNPGGRPKGSPSVEAELRRRLAEGEDGDQLLEGLVNVALRKALKGDHRFWTSILERLDGKVADRIAGADGEGLTVILERAVNKDVTDGDSEAPASTEAV